MKDNNLIIIQALTTIVDAAMNAGLIKDYVGSVEEMNGFTLKAIDALAPIAKMHDGLEVLTERGMDYFETERMYIKFSVDTFECCLPVENAASILKDFISMRKSEPKTRLRASGYELPKNRYYETACAFDDLDGVCRAMNDAINNCDMAGGSGNLPLYQVMEKESLKWRAIFDIAKTIDYADLAITKAANKNEEIRKFLKRMQEPATSKYTDRLAAKRLVSARSVYDLFLAFDVVPVNNPKTIWLLHSAEYLKQSERTVPEEIARLRKDIESEKADIEIKYRKKNGTTKTLSNRKKSVLYFSEQRIKTWEEEVADWIEHEKDFEAFGLTPKKLLTYNIYEFDPFGEEVDDRFKKVGEFSGTEKSVEVHLKHKMEGWLNRNEYGNTSVYSPPNSSAIIAHNHATDFEMVAKPKKVQADV